MKNTETLISILESNSISIDLACNMVQESINEIHTLMQKKKKNSQEQKTFDEILKCIDELNQKFKNVRQTLRHNYSL